MFLTNGNGIYLIKVSNRNITAMCEICSKSTVKTPKRRQGHRLMSLFVFLTDFTHCSGVFDIDFAQVSAIWFGEFNH